MRLMIVKREGKFNQNLNLIKKLENLINISELLNI